MSSCGLQRGNEECSKNPASPSGSIKVTAAHSRWERLKDSVEAKCLRKYSEVRLNICRTVGRVRVSESRTMKLVIYGDSIPTRSHTQGQGHTLSGQSHTLKVKVTHSGVKVMVVFTERQHLFFFLKKQLFISYTYLSYAYIHKSRWSSSQFIDVITNLWTFISIHSSTVTTAEKAEMKS